MKNNIRVKLIFCFVVLLNTGLYAQQISIVLKTGDSVFYKIDETSIDRIDFPNRVFYIKSPARETFFSQVCANVNKMVTNELTIIIILNGAVLLDTMQFNNPYASSYKFFSDTYRGNYTLPDSINFYYIPKYPTLLLSCRNSKEHVIDLFKLLYKHGLYDKWFTEDVLRSLTKMGLIKQKQ